MDDIRNSNGALTHTHTRARPRSNSIAAALLEPSHLSLARTWMDSDEFQFPRARRKAGGRRARRGRTAGIGGDFDGDASEWAPEAGGSPVSTATRSRILENMYA